MNRNFHIDENEVNRNVTTRRDARMQQRKIGFSDKWKKFASDSGLNHKWLLYLATGISASLTFISIFIMLMGEKPDIWRYITAFLFSIMGVFVCEPAVLWWLGRVELHQNKIQLIFGIIGLCTSAALSAKTVYSAGELIVWALGDSMFSNYNVINADTQSWLVHFVPWMVMTHVGLGIIYFAFSNEAAAKRIQARIELEANTEIALAKSDMKADTAIASSQAVSMMIRQIAPQMGVDNARKLMEQFMLDNGFDINSDGKIQPSEAKAFNAYAGTQVGQSKIRQSISDSMQSAPASNNGHFPTSGGAD